MKYKFTLILIIVTAALAVIGFYGQSAFSQLIRSIREESRPNYRLDIIREISNSLVSAENSINKFSITRESEDLDVYYNTVATIDAKLDSFVSLSMRNGLKIKEAISLNQLIEDKLIILNEFIELKDEENSNIAFNRILSEIRKEERRQQEIAVKRDKQVTLDSLNSASQIAELQTEEVEIPETKPKRESIFKKIFGKKKKKNGEEEPEVDSLVEVEIKPLIVQKKPPVIQKPKARTKVIRDIITKIGKEEEAINAELSSRELELLARDETVSDQLNILIANIEKDERQNSLSRADSAEEITKQTQSVVAQTIGFTLFIICLLVVVIFYDLARLNRNRKELNKAKIEAEKLARVKEDFLATMSHEIRTPLTALNGFSEQLSNTLSAEEQSDYLEIIKKSSSHLVTIVNDILDYAKLESGKIVTDNEPFYPSSEINEVIELFEAESRKNDLKLSAEFDFDEALVLQGDALRYRQILMNLVSNALKFTNAGYVKISASMEEDMWGFHLVTSVEDSGIGIEPDKTEMIFGKFEQADNSTTRSYGGTGLGLAIVNKLVKLLNGTITVESELGKGAIFRVSLPFTVTDALPGKEDGSKKLEIEALSGKRILVVDDEEYNLELMRTILDKANVETTIANGGKQALDLINQNSFDCILLDIQMPEMSGLEVAERVGTHPCLIATTASTRAEDFDAIKASGFHDYITKPFAQNELLHKVIINLNGQQPVESLEKMDSLNIDALIELSHGNNEFVENMLTLFLTNTEENFIQLDENIKILNHKNIAMIAHKMVAPTRHLNLSHFTETLKKIEEYAREKSNPDILQPLQNEAHKMWGRIKPTLKMKIEEIRELQLM